jgi:hypothetical protein
MALPGKPARYAACLLAKIVSVIFEESSADVMKRFFYKGISWLRQTYGLSIIKLIFPTGVGGQMTEDSNSCGGEAAGN